jgi:tetratricopeptide (TPR) repeat protein
MQDEIVSRLANTLDAQLVVAEARRAEYSSNPNSMDMFFQGKAWQNKGMTPEYLSRARGFFERALALDPGNVEAMVGEAAIDMAVGASFMTDDGPARFAAAEAAVTKVLSLTPNHAVAHLVLGYVQMLTNRAAEGIGECEQALGLDRNLARAHTALGLGKFLLGRAAETEAHVKEALRLSPRDQFAFVWMHTIGISKTQLVADEEAVLWFRRGLEANRNHSLSHFHLASALARLGEMDQARAAVKAGLALDPSFNQRRLRVSEWSDKPTFLAGRERLFEGMRLAGVPEG